MNQPIFVPLKLLYSRLSFPIDAAATKRRLAFLWWEPIVLLLPWRLRVAFWNWLFDCHLDYRTSSDPFLVQWLQNYWPFRSRWIPMFIHWRIWKFCSPDGAGKMKS
jgi:hypothetical protein